MTVRELAQRITASEFQDWLEYLEWEELRRRTKEDYYLAQIAFEVRRSFVRHPNKVKFSEFYYQHPADRAEQEDKLKTSKSAWFAALDMKLPENKEN